MLKDVLVVGSVTISNNILSGFSSSSYGYINEALPLSSNTVEIVLDLNIPIFNNYDVIMANYNDSYTGGGFVLRTDKQRYGTQLLIWGTSNNSSWTTNLFKTGISLSTGKNLLKIKYNAGTLKLSNSTDNGETFTDGNTLNATFTDFVQPFRFGVSGSQFPATNMSINLANSYIKVNGNYWHSYQETTRTRIIQRHDTAANWTSVNPVLVLGEMGIETDTNKFKFGDGTTAWSNLAYAAGEGGGSASGTTLTSTEGTTTYSKLALGDNLVVSPAETAWSNPAMSSNSQDGYVASASNTQTTNYPYRAFDKDITGRDLCWYTGSVSMPQWIMLECPEPVRLTSCMIMNEVKTPESFKSGYIQGSNDGSTFDTLYTITDRASTASLKTTYQINTDTYYKYLRVYCTATSGSGLSIQEIEFKGFIKDKVAVPTLHANAYTKAETDKLLTTKQDKLIALSPINIEKKKINNFNINFQNEGGILTDNLAYTQTSNMIKNAYYSLVTKEKLDFTSGSPFELCIKIVPTEVSSDSWKWIYRVNPVDDNGTIGIAHSSSNLEFWLKQSGSSSFLPQGAISYTAGNTYYLKWEFTGSKYIASYSTDNITYTEVTSYAYNNILTTLNDSIYAMVFASSSDYAKDTIFLADSYYTINGKKTYFAEIIESGTAIEANTATSTSLGVVQPDGTSITISETGVISGQDVKTFTGYSDTGTLVLKSINGVLQWVAET